MSDDWVMVYTSALPEFTRKEELQKIRKKQIARSKSSRSCKGRKYISGKNFILERKGRKLFLNKKFD